MFDVFICLRRRKERSSMACKRSSLGKSAKIGGSNDMGTDRASSFYIIN